MTDELTQANVQKLTTPEREQNAIMIDETRKRVEEVMEVVDGSNRNKVGDFFRKLTEKACKTNTVLTTEKIIENKLHNNEENMALKINNEEPEINVVTTDIERPDEVKKTGEFSKDKPTASEPEQEMKGSELTITDLGKIIMPLIPGKEIEWVTITRNLTQRVMQIDKVVVLQTTVQQLKNHPDALAKAIALLVQAGREPKKDIDPLGKFYEWLEINYQITKRQQIIKFASLLKGLSWSWKSNPADKLQEILNEVYLTWADIAQDVFLCAELKAAVVTDISSSTFLILNEIPLEKWYEEITSIWMQLRDRETGKTVEAKITNRGKKIQSGNIDEVTVNMASALQSHYSLENETSTNLKHCFRCGIPGHLARNCKTIMHLENKWNIDKRQKQNQLKRRQVRIQEKSSKRRRLRNECPS